MLHSDVLQLMAITYILCSTWPLMGQLKCTVLAVPHPLLVGSTIRITIALMTGPKACPVEANLKVADIARSVRRIEKFNGTKIMLEAKGGLIAVSNNIVSPPKSS